MGFEGQTRPKRHGILKTTFGLILEKTVEGRERERKEEEEEEEEEEGGAKIKQSQAPKRYGTTNLVWILGFVGYLLYPNLGFVRISS